MTYDYITGFEGVLMDVTVFAEEQEKTEPEPEPEPVTIRDPGSPGGCNSTVFEFSCFTLALTLIMFRRKQRR